MFSRRYLPHSDTKLLTAERIEFRISEGLTLVGNTWGNPNRNPIVFLHGGGQTRHFWGSTAHLLAEMGWRTFSIDLRGHADSDWSAYGNNEAQDFVPDITGFVTTLNKKAILVGASLGGRTATFIVGDGLSNLSLGLVLVDITPKIEKKGVERILTFMNKHPNGFATIEEAADAVAEYRPNKSRPQDVSGLKKPSATDEWSMALALGPEDTEPTTPT